MMLLVERFLGCDLYIISARPASVIFSYRKRSVRTVSEPSQCYEVWTPVEQGFARGRGKHKR